MNIKRPMLKLAVAGSVLCLGAGLAITEESAPTSSSSMEIASYTVTFVPSWNPATHPADYPLSHAKHGLLTPIIGATHGNDFTLFAEGQKPSAGLERLSEMGKHDPLDQEIKAAMKKGAVASLIEFSDASPGPVHPSVTTTINARKDSSLVSLVGMIAPSPDWFYGVSRINLQKNGDWIASMAVPVYAWDSGGDAGISYMAEDQDLSPKAATKALLNDTFARNGNRVPVGTFVFKRVPAEMR